MDIAEVERQVFRKLIANSKTLAIYINRLNAEDFQNRLARLVIGALANSGNLVHFSPNKSFFEILLRDKVKDPNELERISIVL
jgi:hypothetical protein